jgi:hypothetical protein
MEPGWRNTPKTRELKLTKWRFVALLHIPISEVKTYFCKQRHRAT